MKFFIFLAAFVLSNCITDNKDRSLVQNETEGKKSLCAFDPSQLIFRNLADNGAGWETEPPFRFTASGSVNGSHRQGFEEQFSKDLGRNEYQIDGQVFKAKSSDRDVAMEEFFTFAKERGIPSPLKDSIFIANQEFQANIIDLDSKVRKSLAQEFGIENANELLFIGNDSKYVFIKESSADGPQWFLQVQYKDISLSTFENIEGEPLGVANIFVTIKLDDVNGTADSGFSVVPHDVQYLLGMESPVAG